MKINKEKFPQKNMRDIPVGELICFGSGTSANVFMVVNVHYSVDKEVCNVIDIENGSSQFISLDSKVIHLSTAKVVFE